MQRLRLVVSGLVVALLTVRTAAGMDLLYTFDDDEARGPYKDALAADGAQDGTWAWDGNPRIETTRPLFGRRSLATADASPIEILPAVDLGKEVTFAVHLRDVAAGLRFLFTNYTEAAGSGRMFICIDPSSHYAGEKRLLRFHYWHKADGALAQIVLDAPVLPDWSKDGKTHHVALTYDHGTATAYFDGRQVAQTSSKASELEGIDLTDSGAALCFGGISGGGRAPLVATCDDVLILGRVLNAEQIAALAEKGAQAAGLVKAADKVPRAAEKESTPAGRLLSAAEVSAVFEKTKRASTPADEWTFEQARQQWKPMVRAVQHVGIPGCQWQTGVTWDGSLVFGPVGFRLAPEVAPLGNNLLHLVVGFGEPMRLVDRTGTGSHLVRKGLDEGRLPIPWVQSCDGDLLWTETVFAHLLDRRLEEGMQPKPDDVQVTQARWVVRNTGFAWRTGHLWLYLGDTSKLAFGYKCGVGDDLGVALSHKLEGSLGMTEGKVRYVVPAPAKGRLVQHGETAAPAGVKTVPRNILHWAVDLAPGEEAELRVLIPYGLVEKAVGEKILSFPSDQLLQEARQFWKERLYRAGQITTPDPFINDYLVAVAGQMAQQVAYRHHPGVWMLKTSPNHYENYWPCNAAKALPTLDFRGLGEINARVLQGFIDMQTDDVRGLDRRQMGQGETLAGEGYAKRHGFLGNFREWTANPLLISHGLALWALAAHYRVTRDQQWLGSGLGSPLQTMLDGFDWVAVQRRRTMREANGRRVPHWGLLPAASAHDWLAGNTIFNDAFCIYGMAEVVRMLREIKHPRAEEMAAELKSYRECLRASYAAARDRARPLPLSDGNRLPFVPRVVQEGNWAGVDWTYTILGPLSASAWGGVLEPHDELVDQSLAYLEAGIPRGSNAFLLVSGPEIADVNWADVSDPQAERHWVWRHYVAYETMWPAALSLFLQRDDLPRFFEALFNNLAAALHHDFRVGVESLDGVPSCGPGDGERWQIIRRMFIHETGGWDGSAQELFLLQALPRSWLRPGNRLSVRDMGTYFGGRVNLHVHMADDGDSVVVSATLDLAIAPARTRMRLRSGDGRPLRAATVNGKPAAVLEGDTIQLPAEPHGRYEIVGQFK